jgi:transposase
VPKWQPPGYRHKEVFVPLSHPPGEAQYDFGEAVVVIAGEQVKAALSVMTLPYSDVFHVSAYPERVHRDLPGRPPGRVRVLGWGAHPHRL